MKVELLLRSGKERLKNAEIASYMLDTEILLSKALRCSRLDLIMNPDYIANVKEVSIYNEYIEKRMAHMPVKYITGICEFMSLDFYVNENVLLPRPDTEILVEKTIELIKEKQYTNILEIGTGSGCIGISLAHYLPGINITATDISENALAVARDNSIKNRTQNIRFLKSDLFERVDGSYDVIISNPPYIEKDEIERLDSSVRDYEPYIALNGGMDGLNFYREICRNASVFLKAKGVLVFEIGYNQKYKVEELFKENNFENIELVKDLSGLDRVLLGFMKGM